MDTSHAGLAREVAALQDAELAAGLLAALTLAVSWVWGLRLAFTTHRVYGAIYNDAGIQGQDRHLLHTDLGAGLAIVALGTLVAALAVTAYITIHALLTPRRAALADHTRQTRLAEEGP